MSLQVWLPLNGDTKNYGLDGDTPSIPINNPTFVDGKLGKCLDLDALTTAQTATFDSLKGLTQYSISCWVKVPTDKTFGNYNQMLTFSTNHDGHINNGIRVEHTTVAGKFQLIYNKSASIGSSTNEYFGIGDTGKIDTGEWNHVVITNDDEYVRSYNNGVLICSHKRSNIYNYGYLTGMVKINAASNACALLSDVRVYDHVLSMKEIKELCKGLCMHYKLSNYYELGLQNKYSGNYAEGCVSNYNAWSVTKLADERGYNYKMSYTGTGGDKWASFRFPAFDFTPGKKYYYSCKVRCHSVSNVILMLRASRSDNDWVTNHKSVLVADGEWHEYYVYQTINETYDRSGYTVTCAPQLEFYTHNMNTENAVYACDFDLKDVQVIESDNYVPFIDNTMSLNEISECSGFGLNGTAVGDIKWVNGSPRYDGCYRFSADSNIKIPGLLALSNTSKFTVSMWVKPEVTGPYVTVLSRYNNFGPDGFWLAINTESSAVWFYNGKYLKGDGKSLPTNTWSHIAIVYDGTTMTSYINGVKTLTSTDVAARDITLGDYIAIGNSYTGTQWNTDFTGCISDVRFYATALSDNDIKELYQTPISLSKSGALFAYEFKEGDYE